MSDDEKKPEEPKAKPRDVAQEALEELGPDTWVFTVDSGTGRVMGIAPNRQISANEVAIVLVNMNVLLGKVASMISMEVPANSVMVKNPGGRKDN